jgi:ribonuclease HI
MNKLEIYTDGACRKNPGPGGWAAVIINSDKSIPIHGRNPNTTNNQMELTAVIKALEFIKEPAEIILYTDSQYICNAINSHWLINWKKHNWIKSDGKPVLNRDLWEKISTLINFHHVTIKWVKGHNNNKYNEICDKLAVAESHDEFQNRYVK